MAAARSVPGASKSMHLSLLYAAVKAECERRGRPLTKHWQAKVRQVVQRSADFERVSKGVWRLTAGASTSR